jgi:hypothetical protein
MMRSEEGATSFTGLAEDRPRGGFGGFAVGRALASPRGALTGAALRDALGVD